MLKKYGIVAVLLCLTTFASAALVSIPHTSGQLLNGKSVDLPADLHGKKAVLVLAFSQGARGQVMEWGRKLSTDIPNYQIAEFAGVPRPLRGWVTRKVKASVPEKAQGRFLIITEHEGEWKSVTGYAASEEAYIVVVDSTGNVLWKTHGAASDAAYADLKRHLD